MDYLDEIDYDLERLYADTSEVSDSLSTLWHQLVRSFNHLRLVRRVSVA